jgi:hypothetical protein
VNPAYLRQIGARLAESEAGLTPGLERMAVIEPCDQVAQIEDRLSIAYDLLAVAERIAQGFESIYDKERRALRLFDIERKQVYRDHLAPEIKDKLGLKE